MQYEYQIPLLNSHLNFVSENTSDFSGEQGERFHQGNITTEIRHQGIGLNP